jgi:hypothetical protein
MEWVACYGKRVETRFSSQAVNSIHGSQLGIQEDEAGCGKEPLHYN